MTEAEGYRFEADGFLAVPGALTPAEVAAVRAELSDAAGRASGYGYAHQSDDLVLAGGTLRSIANPLSSSPVVLDVALHPGFFPKLRDAFGGAVRLLSNEYFITPPGSKPRLGWHRDATEENFPAIALGSSLLFVNCLVLLSDVGPENGPTLAIPGSHRWEVGRQLPDGAVANPEPETVPGHVRLCGYAGTAVFFNARLFHAQSANRSDAERHVLVFVFGYRWMRAFPGFEPTPALCAELAGTPICNQLLGTGPAFDEPVADYEVPIRWTSETA